MPTWPWWRRYRASRSCLPERPAASPHAERFLVHLQNRLFLGDVVGLALSQRDDLAHHLGVVAARLRLGHDLFLLVGDVAFLGLQTFEPFDELAQLVGRHAVAVGAGVGVTMTSVIPRRAGDSSWNNYNFTIMFPSFGIRMFVFKWLTINLGLRLYIMRDVFEASNRPPDDDPNLPSDYNPQKDSQAPRWVPNLTFNLGVSFFLPPSFKYTTFK